MAKGRVLLDRLYLVREVHRTAAGCLLTLAPDVGQQSGLASVRFAPVVPACDQLWPDPQFWKNREA